MDLSTLSSCSPSKAPCIGPVVFTGFVDNNKLGSITDEVHLKSLLEFIAPSLIMLGGKLLKHFSSKTCIDQGSREC